MSNGNTPRISIVTPCFNHARFIEQTMKSVLDQGYPELEYVVMDGGSTDGSRQIIERYSSRLAYWRSEPDRGHGHAINKGFAQTSGEIMAWLNSDDLYMPWTLSTVAEIFSTYPEVQWITGVNGWWDSRGRLSRSEEVFKNQYDFLLGRYEWIQQESTFWRRSLWELAGNSLDESYKFMIDGKLWTQFFQYAPLVHVQCVLGGFRTWGENRSTLHADECHSEMRRAISEMSVHFSSGTIRDVNALRRIGRVAKILPEALIQKVLRRVFAEFLDKCGYETVVWEAGQWRRRHEPYSFEWICRGPTSRARKSYKSNEFGETFKPLD